MPLWLAFLLSYYVIGVAFAVVESSEATGVYDRLPANVRCSMTLNDCRFYIFISYLFLWVFIIAHSLVKEHR